MVGPLRRIEKHFQPESDATRLETLGSAVKEFSGARTKAFYADEFYTKSDAGERMERLDILCKGLDSLLNID